MEGATVMAGSAGEIRAADAEIQNHVDNVLGKATLK
jgi:hypothetical protein